MGKALKFFKKYKALLFLIILIIPVMLPLFREGFFTMHDDQQVARLYELDRALAAGQFPARWVGNLGFGYGYPLFVFYPPFVYYLGEVFHLLFGAGFIISTKLVFAMAFLGAAFSMYVWVKEHFGKIPGVVAAAFYTYAPYHAVDAYVRGALAEIFSFVWLPLVLWATDRLIIKRQRKYWLWLGVFLALLIITHNLIFLPFFPLFTLYSLALWFKADNKAQTAKYLLLSIIFAFGLSAFFWIPAFFEKQHTLVDSILRAELAQYKLHFVYPAQLWNSLWGYAGSTAGPLDGISFKIGKLHIVLAVFAPIFWYILSRLKKIKKSKYFLSYSLILIFLFIFSAFMTTSFSQIIWKIGQPLQYLQFPWRFLTFTALFSSILAGSATAALLKFIKKRQTKTILLLLIVILLLYPNLKLFKPQTYLNVNDEYYKSEEYLKWKISKTSFEFVPKEVKTKTEWNEIEQKEITQVAITRDQIATKPYKILSGIGEVKVIHKAAGDIRLNIKAQEELVLQINQYDFPNWVVKLDGKKTDFSSENDLKLINIKIPPGNHDIQAHFTNTPLRTIANLITLVSLGIILVKRKQFT